MRLAHLPETSVSDEAMQIFDPRDGSLVGEVPATAIEVLPAVLERSVDAAAWWSRTPAADRGAVLRHAASAIADQAKTLARLNARETGRPESEALEGVHAGVQTFLQYAELGPLHRGHSLRGAPDATDYSVHEARGVVLALTPWNDPVAVAAGLIAAALVTGNAVIHKPSERCPHVGAFLGEILERAFPKGVIQTVLGGEHVGSALTQSEDVDVIAHVGSTLTGQRIARVAALTGAHVIRENGGNDPLVIDADVNPAWAAQQAALGAFTNSGQICTSVERIYVHADIADKFIEALAVEAEQRAKDHSLGPLVDERMRSAVHEQVQAAIDSGAQVRAGGVVPEGAGSFYPATVLTGCTPQMTIMTEETFGPVAPVQVVDSFEEGLGLAADDRYGLAANVLTCSLWHAQRAASELHFGTVKINGVFGGAPGGSADPRGDSGSGHGYGPELLDEMTVTKVVHIESASTT